MPHQDVGLGNPLCVSEDPIPFPKGSEECRGAAGLASSAHKLQGQRGRSGVGRNLLAGCRDGFFPQHCAGLPLAQGCPAGSSDALLAGRRGRTLALAAEVCTWPCRSQAVQLQLTFFDDS